FTRVPSDLHWSEAFRVRECNPNRTEGKLSDAAEQAPRANLRTCPRASDAPGNRGGGSPWCLGGPGQGLSELLFDVDVDYADPLRVLAVAVLLVGRLSDGVAVRQCRQLAARHRPIEELKLGVRRRQEKVVRDVEAATQRCADVVAIHGAGLDRRVRLGAGLVAGAAEDLDVGADEDARTEVRAERVLPVPDEIGDDAAADGRAVRVDEAGVARLGVDALRRHLAPPRVVAVGAQLEPWSDGEADAGTDHVGQGLVEIDLLYQLRARHVRGCRTRREREAPLEDLLAEAGLRLVGGAE